MHVTLTLTARVKELVDQSSDPVGVLVCIHTLTGLKILFVALSLKRDDYFPPYKMFIVLVLVLVR